MPLFKLRVFFQSREADFSHGAEFLAKLLNARVKSSALHREDVLCRNVRRYVRSVSFNGFFFHVHGGKVNLPQLERDGVSRFFHLQEFGVKGLYPGFELFYFSRGGSQFLFPLDEVLPERVLPYEKPL